MGSEELKPNGLSLCRSYMCTLMLMSTVQNKAWNLITSHCPDSANDDGPRRAAFEMNALSVSWPTQSRQWEGKPPLGMPARLWRQRLRQA